MDELKQLLHTLEVVGGDAAAMLAGDSAHMVAAGHHVLSSRGIPGVELRAEERREAIVAEITVGRGVAVARPIHLCFGLLHRKGRQRVEMAIRLEVGATATCLAHCLFAQAEKAMHAMDATVEIGPGAELRISEGHYHGRLGGVEVIPKAVIKVGAGGRYLSDFTLTQGKVGRLDMDYRVEVGDHGVVELTSRVFGHGSDRIRIRDEVILAGEGARGLVKTRVAVEDEATSEVLGITEGRAPGARGHIDCLEIVKDQAYAQAIPLVKVTHPLAKVTHEAAIGTVDKRQMETLMAHGLTPEEAVDTIVGGLLR